MMETNDMTEGPFYYDDGAFCIWLTKFGMWKSADREGKALCSGTVKESVVRFAREHLNGWKNCTVTDTGVKIGDNTKL